ncbi:hypothetical protein [Yinghuangia sp. YIM S09857]|uniref:hypothetical protein n=1 Tax=Yinghuangia sp. YIM S09857 TaxID=3436929 RepID=UPI003F52E184
MPQASAKSEPLAVRAVDKLTVGLGALLFTQCLAWLTYAMLVTPERFALAPDLAQPLTGPYPVPGNPGDISAAVALAMVVLNWWGGFGAVKRSVGRKSLGFTTCATANTALLAWSLALTFTGHAMWPLAFATLPVVTLSAIMRAAVRPAPPRVI